MPAHLVQHHGERVSELLYPLRVAEIAQAKGTECLDVVVRERYTHPKTNAIPEPDSGGRIRRVWQRVGRSVANCEKSKVGCVSDLPNSYRRKRVANADKQQGEAPSECET
jgi:hypothetical protein